MTTYLHPAQVQGRVYLAPLTPPQADESPASGVLAVSVTPGNVNINTDKQQFTAAVTGLGNVSQEVTWSTTLGIISQTGLLSVTAADADKSGVVIATSVADPLKYGSSTFTVTSIQLPTQEPTKITGTLVEMHFVTPKGEPVANSFVEVSLKQQAINDKINGVFMPRPAELTTNYDGRCLVELLPCDEVYYVQTYDAKSEATIFYKFYVPEVDDPTYVVRLQDIVVDDETAGKTFDEAALLTIINAKANAVAAATQAKAAAASIISMFNKLSGPDGASFVGYKTGTVADALNNGVGSGTGGGTGGGGGIAGPSEVILQTSGPTNLAKIDGSKGTMFTITVTGDFKIPPVANPVPGQTYLFILTQDTAGNHVVTFDRTYRFSGNTTPVITKDPQAIDILEASYSSSGFFFSRTFKGFSTSQIAKIKSTGVGYDSMNSAMNALGAGDTLYVTRNGQLSECTASITKDGKYTIASMPGLGAIPVLHTDNTIRLAFGKGIINVEQGDVLIRDLGFDGASSDDQTGSGVRFNPGVEHLQLDRITVTNCQNGMLCGIPSLAYRKPDKYNIEIVDSVFDRNGTANGTESGQSHNIYLAHSTRMMALRSKFTNAVRGHDFKTRADFVLLDRCLFQGSNQGRALDVPNGGKIYAENCSFIKNAGANQGNLIGIGQEGITNAEEYIFRNCLFQNDQGANFSETWFVHANSTVPIKFVDCVFIGAAKTLNVGPFELYYTGGPIGPEGWDQSKKGNVVRQGTSDGTGGNTPYAANLQPQPQNVTVDPFLSVFPRTGSTAVPTVRPD
jgi:hypothetical protein